MRYMIAVALAVSIVANTPSWAQSPEARVEAARSRVAQAGLPVSLLDERVAEGRAKGVPMDRIAEAIERRAGAVLEAGNALRPVLPSFSAGELAAGADAVEAGVPGAAIREIVSRASQADRPVALAVLTFLHQQQGLPVETAVARVTEAMARGPDALRELPAQVARASGRTGSGNGAPPTAGPGQAAPGGGRPAAAPGQARGVGRAGGTPAPSPRPPATPPGRQ